MMHEREVGPRHSSYEAGEQSEGSPLRRRLRGRTQRSRWSEGRGPRGIRTAQHVLDPEPGSRDKRAGAYTATFAVTHQRWEPYAGKPHVRFCAGGVR